MEIQAIFYIGNDPLSNFIKKVTRGSISHCGLLIDGIHVADTDFVRNFRMRYLPWERKDFVIVNLKLNDIQKQEIIEWIQINNNKKYDNLENYRYLFRKKISPNDDDNKMNCVEALVNCLVYCGYLSANLNAETMSPTELYKILCAKFNNTN